MGILFRKTYINTDLESCWNFFSSPENLAKITPKKLDFRITDYDGKKAFTGQQIAYTIAPLFNISLKWLTKIQSVTDKKEFVDIQLKGPYKLWHHRHLFKETDKGIKMIDIVHYTLPFGIIGRLAEKVFVKKMLRAIFDHREKQIKTHFA